MEKARGLFTELESWNKLPQKAGCGKGLYSRDLVTGACEAMPRNVTCGTSLSSFGTAQLFVLQRAGCLGKEQLCHHLPEPEFQVTLSIAWMKITVWELFVQQMWVVEGKGFTSHQTRAHKSFSCSSSLCWTFYTFTGKTLSVLSDRTRPSAHLPFTP